MKNIAIFDIDGTIFRSSLMIEVYHELVRMGVFSKRSYHAIEKKHSQWLDRAGGYEHYMMEVVKQYVREIKGKKRSDVVKASRKMLKAQKMRTYRYTRHLIEKLQKTHFIIGISGSPLEVVKEYNTFLKFDKIYGSEFGIDERGRYTGAILHEPPRYKKEVIVRYIQNHDINMKGSIGVGDTESDVGFLDLVDQPIAFNPNTGLFKEAKKKGYKVVIERKDLIVEFNPKKVKYLKA